ncbi:uncharacterized protein IUM83_14083 [Phytophthora cinnamomi]|uniref:uncharacterized protein n=1 Tax=Phytophthora cinnamomi TaxID=4785 RepID=UPI00355A9613|nr:hypothetical protein IUM83_14083 [Phytophthora cinnamomi]
MMLSLPKVVIGKRRWHSESPQKRGEHFDSSAPRDRGVLMCMHNGVLALGVSLIRELRCLGNRELIQVYHCGPSELSQESRDLLIRIDDRLELIDVCSDLTQRGKISQEMAAQFRNWWIKPLAMYHTDIRHVMLMDVDDIFIRDPSTLRDLELYKTTGTTFFYDRVHANCEIYVNGIDLGIPYLKKLFATFNYGQFNVTGGNTPSQQALNSFAYNGKACHEMDSSLVLVDKERAGQTVMEIMFWFITTERFRFDFSFGDKEAFWLSFEMAHAPYAFSPWGVSVVSSWPNEDIEKHPDSLCGSILQYLPDNSTGAQVLYVNGKALLDPYPEGINFGPKMQRNNMFNTLPTHMAPRLPRTELNKTQSQVNGSGIEKMFDECLVGLGATPLPQSFAGRLLRRRLHFLGAMAGVVCSLELCGTF